PYRILGEKQEIKAEGVIPDDGRLPRISFETPDEAVLIVGEEAWDWAPVPTIHALQGSPDSDEGDEDDEPPDAENSRYVPPGGTSAFSRFLTESAVEAHLS
ncbi:type VI secretion system tip protein VgrG, partial [Mycobacterium tuberculosis]